MSPADMMQEIARYIQPGKNEFVHGLNAPPGRPGIALLPGLNLTSNQGFAQAPQMHAQDTPQDSSLAEALMREMGGDRRAAAKERHEMQLQKMINESALEEARIRANPGLSDKPTLMDAFSVLPEEMQNRTDMAPLLNELYKQLGLPPVEAPSLATDVTREMEEARVSEKIEKIKELSPRSSMSWIAKYNPMKLNPTTGYNYPMEYALAKHPWLDSPAEVYASRVEKMLPDLNIDEHPALRRLLIEKIRADFTPAELRSPRASSLRELIQKLETGK
jgi:hypothetical protein